jgi:hypothetical protein
MKSKIHLIIFLFSAGLSFGQTKNISDEQLIKNSIKDSFDDIFSEFKAEKIDKYYTKDFVLLESGELWNNDSISKYCRTEKLQEQTSKRVNKFEFIKIEISNGTAWVAYQNYASWVKDDKVVGKAHWLESAAAIKTKEGWKLQMLHSTYVKD